MDDAVLLEVTYRMLLMVLLLSLPVVLTSVVVGLVIGILQAITQIQDQSIAYGAKLIAAVVVIGFMARWAGAELLVYARHTFEIVSGMR